MNVLLLTLPYMKLPDFTELSYLAERIMDAAEKAYRVLAENVLCRKFASIFHLYLIGTFPLDVASRTSQFQTLRVVFLIWEYSVRVY